jgi:hypothetical protein
MYLFIKYWYYYKCQAYGRLIFLCTWETLDPGPEKNHNPSVQQLPLTW